VDKVLITGGAGFIGLTLAKELLKQGFEVHIVDNFSRAVKDPELQTVADDENVKLVTCDVLNEDGVMDLDKDYDLIYHLAAIIGVQHVLNRPYDVLTLNVKMLSNMIRLGQAQKALKRFLFASTSEVYAGTLQYFDLPVPTPESVALTVTDLKQPRTSYMLSKIYGEAICHHSGLPITIFRPHNIYGPRMGMSHVIPELLQRTFAMDNGGEIEVYSVDHKRAFCFVGDAVNMLIAMGLSEACLGKVYNLGNQNNEISMGELAGIVLKVVGKEATIKPLPATAGSPTRRCPEMSAFENDTGVTAEIGVSEGIGITFEWYKDVFDGNKTSAK
jgi:nucleoside-diphosphate-sugar epimerase